MAEVNLPGRNEIETKYKWNAESVFPDVAAWDAEAARLTADLAGFKRFQGRLADGPDIVADALAEMQELGRRVYVLGSYAGIAYAVDTTDAEAGKRYGRANGLQGQVAAAVAFVEPELLALGEASLRRLVEQPKLAYLKHYVDNLLRNQAHVRSAEVEELLGLVASPFGNVEQTHSLLIDADLKYPPAVGADGEQHAVSNANLPGILASPDRAARRTAWEGYMDQFLAHKNSLASNLLTSVKANVFTMRARRHESTLDLALFPWNLPTETFYNLLSVFKKNLPTWHRYWRVRQKGPRRRGVESVRCLGAPCGQPAAGALRARGRAHLRRSDADGGGICGGRTPRLPRRALGRR